MAIKLVDVAEVPTDDPPFAQLASIDGEAVEWRYLSAAPRSWLERMVRRPRLARYRATHEAVRALEGASAVITHMPSLAVTVGNATRRREPHVPHLAFSFNFLRLPEGRGTPRAHSALLRVDQFAVFTEFEADEYAERLSLPRERFRPVAWTQPVPIPGTVPVALRPTRPYFAAIGGEGRDFAILLDAARALPDVSFMVIARPTPELRDPPPNMRVLFNQPWQLCWSLAAEAMALLVPLKSSTTCSGHITLVSARMLGLPIVTTRSLGTREYSEGYAATTLVEVGDIDGMIAALTHLADDPARARALAQGDAGPARERHDRAHWNEYLAEFVRRVR